MRSGLIINIYTFIRHKSRLRKYERKTQRQKYYVQGQTERDLSMLQTHITEKAINTSTN